MWYARVTVQVPGMGGGYEDDGETWEEKFKTDTEASNWVTYWRIFRSQSEAEGGNGIRFISGEFFERDD